MPGMGIFFVHYFPFCFLLFFSFFFLTSILPGGYSNCFISFISASIIHSCLKQHANLWGLFANTIVFFFLFFRNWLCKLTVHQLLKSPLLCTGFLHFDMLSLVGKKKNWNKVAINRTENVLVCCFLVIFSVWRCTFMVNEQITMTEIFPYLCPCYSLVLCRYSFACLVKLSWEISSRPHCHG